MAKMNQNQMALDRSGFFAHHGPWAIGVRWFRAMSFAPKALLISAVLLLPMAVVFSVYMRNQMSDIAFAKDELQGAEMIGNYAPVLRGVIDIRNAARVAQAGFGSAEEVNAARDALDGALDKFDKYLTASGDPLQFRSSFNNVQQNYREARAAGIKGDAASQDALAKVSDAAKAAEQDLADKSNLSLDPDASSYYLQALVTGEISSLALNLGELRAWSTVFLVKKSLEQADQRNFVIWNSRVGDHNDAIRDDVSRALTAEPSLTVSLNVLDDADGYRKQAAATVLDGAASDPARLWADGKPALDAMFSLYGQALPALNGLLQARVDRFTRERDVLLLVFGLALILAGYFFYSFYLVMQGGLDEVRRHLQAMTAGDLTTDAKPWGRDEIASLMLSLSQMQESLRKIVGQVRESSNAIVSASDEIAQASMDLSGRTEKAAADLEADAAAMEQISSAVKNSVANANEAATIAAGNARVAERGGTVISEVVATMQDIHGSSRKISEIIGTIDGIAFQTNILALNAAVEAARAGEQGRGFAVVAGEVRNLAQRSAVAAREIKSLITSSVNTVESGTRTVEGAGSTMRELVSNAQRMNALLVDISSAVREQSSGVNQVGASIIELDTMTQQNAALVEQSTAAAHSLRDQSVGLAAAVSTFKLPEPA